MILFIGCISCTSNIASNEYLYTLTYVVYYPDMVDTITVASNNGFYWGTTARGVNVIKEFHTHSVLFNGTNDYRILSYTFE